MKKIVCCKKCGAKLAVEKNGWIEVKGRTNFKSDGSTWSFICKNFKCNYITTYYL